MSKEIKIKCKGADVLSYKDLTPFQGGMKTLHMNDYKRLRKEIAEVGFADPIGVWQHEGKNYIEDGHQRLRVVRQMVEKEGWSCPPLPVSFIYAKDEKEARRILLALASNYGQVTLEGLEEQLAKAGLDWPDVESSFRFPEISSEFTAQPISEDEAFANLIGQSHKDFVEMNFVVHETQVSLVKEALKKADAGGDGINKNRNGAALIKICEEYVAR